MVIIEVFPASISFPFQRPHSGPVYARPVMMRIFPNGNHLLLPRTVSCGDGFECASVQVDAIDASLPARVRISDSIMIGACWQLVAIELTGKMMVSAAVRAAFWRTPWTTIRMLDVSEI